jgi:hypothetical protein
MNVAEWHPDRVISRMIDRLPRSWQDWVGLLFVIFAWYGLINSTLSVLSDLRWVLDAGRWVIEHAGSLRDALLWLGGAVHGVVALWRLVTAPLFDLLFGWLRFDAPSWAIDLAVIAFVYLGALLRGQLLLWSSRAEVFR